MDRENNYKLEIVDLSDDTEVAHTVGTNTQLLQPPVGFVYEVMAIDYDAPTIGGSSSGTHRLYITPDSFISPVALIIATFASYVRIRDFQFYGNQAETPSAAASQFTIINSGLVASYDHPITFEYFNWTDVAQAGTRALIFVVKKYREAI